LLNADPEKQALADLFSGTSATHDAAGGLFGHFGALLVDRARLSPGDRVLDVAAGTGASLVPAAQRVGDAGSVVGLDLAPGMVDRLRERIARLGIENAEALVGDAESLPFPDATFDAVLCCFGLFFFPDTDRALGEIKRVLRRGGRLALSTFTRAGSDSMDAMWARIGAFMPVPPDEDHRLRFDEISYLRNALERAEFEEVSVEASPFDLVFPDVDTWMGWLRSMEFGQYLARMTPGILEQFRQSAASDFFRQTGGPQVRLPMDAYLTLGRRPSRL
jgi:ubiquinone/menaquinone biosynthesis C-methylase UbiE